MRVDNYVPTVHAHHHTSIVIVILRSYTYTPPSSYPAAASNRLWLLNLQPRDLQLLSESHKRINRIYTVSYKSNILERHGQFSSVSRMKLRIRHFENNAASKVAIVLKPHSLGGAY